MCEERDHIESFTNIFYHFELFGCREARHSFMGPTSHA
jgi:hypothetical protein